MGVGVEAMATYAFLQDLLFLNLKILKNFAIVDFCWRQMAM